MVKETGRDIFYVFIVIILAAASSIAIWKTSEQIVYNTIAVADVNIKRTGSELKVFEPTALATVKTPILIKGSAPGSWYFEAVFPIKITDESGVVLGEGQAKAKSNWMTEKPVPFEAKISFEKNGAQDGFIVFAKDDPSGRGFSKSVSIPVFFGN
jgi:hypothetical protein